MMRSLAVAAIMLLAASGSAQCEMTSGTAAYGWCQSAGTIGNTLRIRGALALGYVAGLNEAATEMAANIETFRPRYLPQAEAERQNAVLDGLAYVTYGGTCVPASVSNGQMTDIFCAYLRDNPQERQQQPAFFLYKKALAKAFPCSGR